MVIRGLLSSGKLEETRGTDDPCGLVPATPFVPRHVGSIPEEERLRFV